MGDRLDIDGIRQRHKFVNRSRWETSDGIDAHEDRGILLAEVDRLGAENDGLRTELRNITPSRQDL